MKLIDLFEETSSQYVRRLGKLGIKRLGKGAFAAVFQHPYYENLAVKFFETDSGYQKYLNIIKTKNNPWMPRVVAVEKVSLLDEHNKTISGYLVFFEKLKPLTRSIENHAVAYLLKDLPEEFFYHRGAPVQHPSVQFYSDKKDVRISDFDNPEVWAAIKKYHKDPHVKELASVLSKFNDLDIHAGNVMIRPSTKQAVFTDPVHGAFNEIFRSN